MPTEVDNSQVKVITSKQFAIDWRDLTRGALLAVISAVLTTLQTSIAANGFVFNWKAVSIIATTTLISYLLKNFFTPAQTVVQFKPPVQEQASVVVTPQPEQTTKP